MANRLMFVPAFLTALVVLAMPASAIFLETPLHLAADKTDVETGDTVKFHVEPGSNESRELFADKPVLVRWSLYDENGTAQDPRLLRDDLVLDGQSQVTLEWIIPEEADDRNVFVMIERNEEILAQTMLVVGDAEPLLMAMSGEAPEPRPMDRNEDLDKETAKAPGAGILLALGALAAVVLIARRQ